MGVGLAGAWLGAETSLSLRLSRRLFPKHAFVGWDVLVRAPLVSAAGKVCAQVSTGL